MRNNLLIYFIPFILICCGKLRSESSTEQLTSQDIVKHRPVQILGFHFYWMKDEVSKKYRYDSLNAICYVGCELNPNTGSFNSTHDWLTSFVVDSAKANGVKVYLGISINGINSELFLKNQQAKLTSIDTIFHLLMARDADGVVIHFENVSDSQKNIFSNYINSLHHKLSKQNKTIMISVPSLDLRQATYLDFTTLNSMAEYFIVGENFIEINEYRSSAATLFSDTSSYVRSIKNMIQYCTNENVPISKLIVTIPTYQGKFKIEDSNLFENSIGGIGIWCDSAITTNRTKLDLVEF
jgi:spore germination protein YaaH